MIIRRTVMGELDEVCGIYAAAREFMRHNGNTKQWINGHPSREAVTRDIEAGRSYVCINDDEIAAVFYYCIEPEPTYAKIDGHWLCDEPYGVIHRIARSRSDAGNGAGEHCLNWCYEQCRNLRIDTHSDNAPMKKLLGRLGFAYCGIIWIENGDERMAYQKRDKV